MPHLRCEASAYLASGKHGSSSAHRIPETIGFREEVGDRSDCHSQRERKTSDEGELKWRCAWEVIILKVERQEDAKGRIDAPCDHIAGEHTSDNYPAISAIWKVGLVVLTDDLLESYGWRSVLIICYRDLVG